MYGKNLFLALALLFLTARPVLPTIESCAAFGKQHKKILILGDMVGVGASEDASLLTKSDARDSKIVFDLVKRCTHSTAKIDMILEASNWDLAQKNGMRKKISKEFYMGMYYALPYFALEHSCVLGPVHFTFADVRKKALRNVVEFFNILDNPAFRSPLTLAAGQQMIKELLSVETLQDVFTQAELVIAHFEQALASQVSPQLAAYVSAKLTAIKAYKEGLSQQFGPQQKAQPFVDVFIAIAVNRSLNAMIDLFMDWIKPMTDMIADMGLVLALISSLEQYDNVLIFTANNHAIALQKFLMSQGYQAKFIEGNIVPDTNKAAEFLEPGFAPERLSTLLNSFVCWVMPHQEQVLKSCAACSKTECVSRCSVCKLVYYCSRDCQNAHWPTHKLVCTKQ